MLKYILQRLLQGLLVMLALYTIVFFLVGWMPGDPFSSNEKNISPEVRENMKKAWGLDQPLWKQYLIYPKNLITEGSLGVSTEKNRPVWDIIIQSFPASLILGISALFIAVGIGVPIGILSATRKNTAIDYGGMAIAMIGICIPSFIIGPVLQLTLAAKIPALKAPSIAKQPIGTPFGICAIESKLSKPFSFFVSIGTPRTGKVVKDATIPAK